MMYQRDIKSDHAAFNYFRIRAYPGVKTGIGTETLRMNMLPFLILMDQFGRVMAKQDVLRDGRWCFVQETSLFMHLSFQ